MKAKVKKWIKRCVISVERHAEQEKEVTYWYFQSQEMACDELTALKCWFIDHEASFRFDTSTK